MKRILLLFAASYLGLTGCVGTLQKKFLFPGSRDMVGDPSVAGLDFEEVWLSADGVRTHAWFVPLENARGTVLFSHGNAGNLSHRIGSIELLRSFGFSVLAYDYGGYGRSPGRPSEKRCYEDILLAWTYLTQDRGIPPERILLFGRSLGGGPTVELARATRPGAVILESTFLSTRKVAKETSLRPLARLVRHEFDNEGKIGELQSPILIIHSPEDEVVPYAHGRRLYELAPYPKRFLRVQGGHNTPRTITDPAYRSGWEAFLAPIFGLGPRDSNSRDSQWSPGHSHSDGQGVVDAVQHDGDGN